MTVRPVADSVITKSRFFPLTINEVRERRSAESWLVNKLIPLTGFAVVYGQPGSGKTFQVLDLALSIVQGKRWFGKRVIKGAALYVAAESNPALRLMAYQAHFKVTDADLANFRVIAAAPNLLGADIDHLLIELKRAAESLGGIRLVVIDTLSASMPGGDENSPIDMGRINHAVRQIVDALNCCVLLVHHSGKDDSRGARGHSSLRAAVDAEFHIEASGEERMATVTKLRDGETGTQLPFKLVQVDLGKNTAPDADPDEIITSCVIEPLLGDITRDPPPLSRRELALQVAEEALAEVGVVAHEMADIPDGVKVIPTTTWTEKWRQKMIGRYKDAPTADAALRSIRSGLIKDGTIMVANDHFWLTPKPENAA